MVFPRYASLVWCHHLCTVISDFEDNAKDQAPPCTQMGYLVWAVGRTKIMKNGRILLSHTTTTQARWAILYVAATKDDTWSFCVCMESPTAHFGARIWAMCSPAGLTDFIRKTLCIAGAASYQFADATRREVRAGKCGGGQQRDPGGDEAAGGRFVEQLDLSRSDCRSMKQVVCRDNVVVLPWCRRGVARFCHPNGVAVGPPAAGVSTTSPR